MKSVLDTRRIRVHQMHISDGELKSSSATDLWQTSDGEVHASGLWDGVVPLMLEDMSIRASRIGISPLEWLRQRLMFSPLIEVEIIDA